MKFYTVAKLKAILASFKDDAEFSEDILADILLPTFGDEYFIRDGEWKLHEKGLEPTPENVKAWLRDKLDSRILEKMLQ